MDVKELLAVPLHRPDRVFQRDVDLKEQYRPLAMKYHPDRLGGNDDAFAHLEALYREAEHRLKDNDWPGVTRIVLVDGREFDLRYVARHSFDFGECYVGRLGVCYVIRVEYTDLAEAAVKTIAGLKFPTIEFEKKARRYMAPKPRLNAKLVDGRTAIVFDKRAEQFRLRDVLDYHHGKLDVRHVAWIISSVLDLNCALAYGPALMHGEIDLDSYFVDVADHTGTLLGGWWVAQHLGQPLQALPGRTAALVPLPAKGKPLATPAIGSALARALGKELLGSAHGSKLLMDKSIPRPVLDWVRSPPLDDALKDYAEWEVVLKKAFGKRSFHKMELTEKQLYP